MILPYTCRLMTLINSEPVELVRFNRHVANSDIAFFTRDLSGPWWKERPLQERECISSRPVPVTTPCDRGPKMHYHQRVKIKDYVA